jgi:lipopolysaccharide export LptBFGC system permease protein LptF
MGILDRFVAARFLANFAFVFAVMFLFAVSIDTILELDEYTDAAQAAIDAGRFGSLWTALPAAILDFHAPRVFQFYAYMVGLCSVASAGFTLVQMSRTRELVAMLAAGISLWRVALVIGAAAVGLNLLQLVSGEIVLPRLAPLLVREHSSILRPTVESFSVKLVEDKSGRLVLAQRFDPATETISNLVVLERDANGGAVRRIEAPKATWNAERIGWDLENGFAAGRSAPGPGGAAAGTAARIDEREPIDFVATDISPRSILARRFRGFAQLLSAPQIAELAREGGIDDTGAARLVGQRFAGALVNLLMLAICLPFFLVREPRKMLQPSVICAATAVPGLLGSLFVMSVAIPGIPPMVGVFLPVALLLPIAAGRIGALRT